MSWRGRLTWPVPPEVKSAELRVGVDLTSAANGMRWLTPGRDWAINGRRTQTPSPREVALPPSFPAPPWMAYAGHGMSLLFFPRVPNGLPPQKLQYRDDSRFPAGAEPGAWGSATYQYDLAKLKTGAAEVGFQLLFAKGDGEVKRLAVDAAAALGRTLTITARETPGRGAN
jgi:hypothetical protein